MRRGLKERRARTNRASNRRECLRTYPACINKEAAERTEMRAKTARAAQRERTMSSACVCISRLCPAVTF